MSNTELPEGWEWKKLGEVCILLNGRAYKQEELLDSGSTPVLRVGNFFSNRGWYYSNLELEENKYCDFGDLLYAWSASFGPKIWDGGKVIYHYHIWKVIPKDSVQKEFLYRFLSWDTEKIKEGSRGVGMLHMTKGDMEKRAIPLPPLPTQRRIVAKIDAVFTRLDEAIQLQKQNLARTAELKKSVLEEVFGTASFKFKSICLKDLVMHCQAGLVRTVNEVSEVDTGVGYVKMNNLESFGKINFERKFFIQATPKEIEKYELNKFDILINVRNSYELVGKFGIYEGTFDKAVYNHMLLMIRLNNNLIYPYFLIYLMSSKEFQSKLDSVKKGTTNIVAIYQSDLLQLEVKVPPLPEQQQIVTHLDRAFAQIDALHAEQTARLQHLESLKSSILAEAFQGKL